MRQRIILLMTVTLICFPASFNVHYCFGDEPLEKLKGLNRLLDLPGFYEKSCRPKPGRKLAPVTFLTFNFESALCREVEKSNPEGIAFYLKEELKAQKEKTGICYSLADPEFYQIISCIGKRKLFTHAVLSHANSAVTALVSTYGIDINVRNKNTGRTVVDYVIQKLKNIEKILSENKSLSDQEKKADLQIKAAWEEMLQTLKKVGGKTGAELDGK